MQGAKYIEEIERQGRIYQYLNQQDDFTKISRWPTPSERHYSEKREILKAHKTNRDRYKIFQFLAGNGLHPETAKKWTLIYDVRGDNIITGNYDKSAHLHMKQLSDMHNNGMLYKYPYYDLITGKMEKQIKFN